MTEIDVTPANEPGSVARHSATRDEIMEDQLVLEHENGTETLGPRTLFFAVDETGHEDFNDQNYPIFGFGGCGCMIRDYSRLIEKPWEDMCNRYFNDNQRPLHATNIKFSAKQIGAVNHFFTKFEFFRVSALASKNTLSIKDFGTIEVVANALLNRICEVGRWAEFDRVFLVFEESQRIEMEVMRSLAKKKIKRNGIEIPVELALMPKSSCNPALEIADFVVHTAGRQVRHRNTKDDQFLPDFTSIFKTIDNRLQSFMEITEIRQNN